MIGGRNPTDLGLRTVDRATDTRRGLGSHITLEKDRSRWLEIMGNILCHKIPSTGHHNKFNRRKCLLKTS